MAVKKEHKECECDDCVADRAAIAMELEQLARFIVLTERFVVSGDRLAGRELGELAAQMGAISPSRH